MEYELGVALDQLIENQAVLNQKLDLVLETLQEVEIETTSEENAIKQNGEKK